MKILTLSKTEARIPIAKRPDGNMGGHFSLMESCVFHVLFENITKSNYCESLSHVCLSLNICEFFLATSLISVDFKSFREFDEHVELCEYLLICVVS